MRVGMRAMVAVIAMNVLAHRITLVVLLLMLETLVVRDLVALIALGSLVDHGAQKCVRRRASAHQIFHNRPRCGGLHGDGGH